MSSVTGSDSSCFTFYFSVSSREENVCEALQTSVSVCVDGIANIVSSLLISLFKCNLLLCG